MSESQITRKEFDELRDDLRRMLDILGDVFIPAEQLTRIKNLNENTISRNDKIEKYCEVGKRKLLVSLSSVPMIKNRKKRRQSSEK